MQQARRPNIDHLENADFMVMGGIEVTAEDFVAIWNGEEILPALSPNELESIERLHGVRRFGNTMGDGEDASTIFTNIASSLGLDFQKQFQKNKRRKLQSLINRYQQSVQNRQVLQIDRVLAVLSNGQLRFDDVGSFIARFSEPEAEAVESIQAATKEVNEIIPGNGKSSSYVDNRSALPIACLDPNSKREVENTLATQNDNDLIPIFLVERALAGHEVTDDEFADLSLQRNIGSDSLISIMQELRIYIMLVGMITALTGIFTADQDHMERTEWLFYGGGATFLLGMLGMYFPTSALRAMRRMSTSKQRYQKFYEDLCKKVEELRKTPAGKVRIELLSAMLQISPDETNSQSVALLKQFVDLMNARPEIEKQFNDLFTSTERSMENPNDVLEVIRQFLATVHEISTTTGKRFPAAPEVIDAEFEDEDARALSEDEAIAPDNSPGHHRKI